MLPPGSLNCKRRSFRLIIPDGCWLGAWRSLPEKPCMVGAQAKGQSDIVHELHRVLTTWAQHPRDEEATEVDAVQLLADAQGEASTAKVVGDCTAEGAPRNPTRKPVPKGHRLKSGKVSLLHGVAAQGCVKARRRQSRCCEKVTFKEAFYAAEGPFVNAPPSDGDQANLVSRESVLSTATTSLPSDMQP